MKGRSAARALLLSALLLVQPAAHAAGSPEEIRLKHERAWVREGPLEFGAEPYELVRSAAEQVLAARGCALSPQQAAHLTLAPTWPEVAASGRAPAPMALSRYDAQTGLADPEHRAQGLFFTPGAGMWQLDTAGLGAAGTAADAIDVHRAAQVAAERVIGRYCERTARGMPAEDARAAAWSPWYACDQGACEDVYQRLSRSGVVLDPAVGRYGGAQPRTCSFEGRTYDCLHVDPARAEGDAAWAAPGYGPAPLPAPFYVFRYPGAGGGYEVRYWLAEDSGARTDVAASRELGVDARDQLSWSAESSLCDTTAGRGNCPPATGAAPRAIAGMVPGAATGA